MALTMRLLGGLGTEEVARAFLVSDSTMAQRIVRAKRRLKEARAPFEVPQGEELDERLPSVLEVIYLLFSVRADLLAKLGRNEEARAEFERAAAMTGNARERELLRARAASL